MVEKGKSFRMKITRWITLSLLLFGLAACTGSGNLLPGSTQTSSLPTAQITVIPAPDANAALRGFLDAQLLGNYPGMYALLSHASQAAVARLTLRVATPMH